MQILRIVFTCLLCSSFFSNRANDTMPIIAFLGVPDWQTSANNFRLINECGFTTSIQTYSSLSAMIKACRQADEYGINILGQCPEMFSAPTKTANILKKERGFFGYYMHDEPSLPVIWQRQKEFKELHSIDSTHCFYINLHPYYHQEWVEPTLKVKTYQEYLRAASQTICQQLSFDFYPITTAGIRPTWYKNLEMIRRECQLSGKPFWAFVLCTPHDVPYTHNTYYPQPTLASLRLQVYSNLAYGAQAIQYFTYWQPDDSEGFHFHDAPVTRDGQKTKTYYLVQQMNRELKTVARLFYGAKMLSVNHLGGTIPEGTTRLSKMPINLSSLKVVSKKGAIVSQLEKNGHRYLAIVNKDYKGSMKILIKYSNDTPRQITKQLKDVAVSGSYNIEPGDILLFRLK